MPTTLVMGWKQQLPPKSWHISARQSNFFWAEYVSILFMSLLFCIIFLGRDVYSFLFYFKINFISFLFVWVRGTLPRFRYDKLMYLA